MTDTLIKKYKFPTGFCASGWHEGENPDLGGGKSAPTCKFYLTCPCGCHAKYDEMFSVAELPRIVVNNSSYRVDNPYWMPSPEERARMHLETLRTHEDVEVRSSESEHTPDVVVRSFRETPTGRQARGQLEQNVLLATTRWVESGTSEDCDIKWIVRNIEEVDGIKLPSTGAVHAALKKWMDIGFAMAGGRPFQFFGFTPEGKRLGLEAMKLRTRDAAKTRAREQAHHLPSLRRKKEQ